jgi:hypothetical protein
VAAPVAAMGGGLRLEKKTSPNKASFFLFEAGALTRDKISLLGFTTLHDTRRYAIPQCWAPHTQTQRHGVRR